ncbi:MAG: (d)CMP kinase [Dysgonamonadaceae bacterium]|jgi:cytidylate kinase|nr:(d)CMP kinase [Dysgonamonadaceae bacterium]
MKKMVVAIDGHSSCGKSTMAKELARVTGYTYIDSGAMYRAVTLYCLEHGLFKGDAPDGENLRKALRDIHLSFQTNPETGRSETYLNGRNVEKEIRSMEVADKVSPVAAIGFVREEMVKQQQALGREKGIVMDGRDIGTVVFPNAELKLFVTASPEIRAQRRLEELTAKGESTTLEEVLHNLSKRDRIDSTRKDGPLKKAVDAIVIDNSNLSISEQNRKVLELFEEIAQK